MSQARTVRFIETICSVAQGTQREFMDRSVIKWEEEMVKGWSRNLRFHPGVENCTLLGQYAASSGDFLQTFRDNLSVPTFWVQESKRLSRNVGKKLPLLAV